MTTLSALVAPLTLYTFAVAAFAGNTNYPRLPKDCVPAPQGNASTLTLEGVLL